jgi:hypothetical protein
MIKHKNYRLTPDRRLKSTQEWSDIMKTSKIWNFRTIAGRMMMGLVLTLMIGGMGVSPALAKDHYKGGHDNGRYEHRGRGYDHDRGYYRNPYVHGRPVYRPYGYSYGYRGRVYAPPPVIYAPPPPPGIGIFLPPIVIHP